MPIPLGIILTISNCLVRYRINGGQEIEFFVPGAYQNMRWAAHSVRIFSQKRQNAGLRTCFKCNGFSAGVNPDDFKGPGFQSGFDPGMANLADLHNKSLTEHHSLAGFAQ